MTMRAIDLVDASICTSSNGFLTAIQNSSIHEDLYILVGHLNGLKMIEGSTIVVR